jgi:amino acid adenylation domain-containing protein
VVVPDTVHALLDRVAAAHPTRRAVSDAAGAWTYEELLAHSVRLAGCLRALGAGPGTRVVVLLEPGRDFAAMLFATSRAGAALVPLGADTPDYKLRQVLENADPTAVIVNEDHAAEVRALGTSIRVVPVASLRGDAGAVTPVPAGAPAFLLYTSGSTAQPKAVVCPHAAVTFAVASIAERLGYRGDDVVHGRLPVSFDYGLYQFLLCATSGAELAVPPGPVSARELIAIRQAGVTVVPLVPMLATLLTRLAARDRRPTAIRLFTNTGEALVGANVARLRAAFPSAALICMYGMTECKRITIADPDEDLVHPSTVGTALPGTRLFVLDPHDRPVAPGTTGRIVAAGPHVMDGYWRAPQATSKRFGPSPDGVGRAVFTGDEGYVDEAGRLYFVGRHDDIFKRRGWRTSAPEIEAALLDIPGVEAAAVLPPPPGGALTAWVVSSLTAQKILTLAATRLEPAKIPDVCVVLPELPQTTHGKVDKRALGALAGEGGHDHRKPAGDR